MKPLTSLYIYISFVVSTQSIAPKLHSCFHISLSSMFGCRLKVEMRGGSGLCWLGGGGLGGRKGTFFIRRFGPQNHLYGNNLYKQKLCWVAGARKKKEARTWEKSHKTTWKICIWNGFCVSAVDKVSSILWHVFSHVGCTATLVDVGIVSQFFFFCFLCVFFLLGHFRDVYSFELFRIGLWILNSLYMLAEVKRWR